MGWTYNFKSINCVPFTGVQTQWPIILLYLVFTVVDIVPTATIIIKMSRVVRRLKNASILTDVYAVIQHREEMRVNSED